MGDNPHLDNKGACLGRYSTILDTLKKISDTLKKYILYLEKKIKNPTILNTQKKTKKNIKIKNSTISNTLKNTKNYF